MSRSLRLVTSRCNSAIAIRLLFQARPSDLRVEGIHPEHREGHKHAGGRVSFAAMSPEAHLLAVAALRSRTKKTGSRDLEGF